MTERGKTIGFMASYTGGSYFGMLLEGVYQVARRRGVRLVAVQRRPEDRHTDQIARNVIDGWIIVRDAEAIARIQATGLPVVTLSTSASNVPIVLPDNQRSMYELVRHLIGHGHRRIAFVGCESNFDVQERFKGYQAALRDAGIPFDPALVIAVADEMEPAGSQGAQQLLQIGVPCTAIAAGTDRNALGVAEVLQRSGYRIPDDIAITGFDDIPQAQAFNPPLTTVRQRFDILGATATELLLSLIDGTPAPGGPVYVPTSVIIRSSCGCDVSLANFLTTFGAAPGSDWRAALAHELVMLSKYPQLPDQHIDPTLVWPGVTTIIGALDAALAGRDLPDTEELAQAWQQAVDITADIDVLNAMIDQIERAAQPALGGLPPESRGPVEAALQAIRREMMRARVAVEVERVGYLDLIMRANNAMNAAMIRTLTADAPRLDWIQFTPATWGCLGLWPGGQRGEIEIVSTYDRHARSVIPAGQRYRVADFPPIDDLPQPDQPDEFHMLLLLPIRTASREWGVLLLSGPLQPQGSTFSDPVSIWADMMGGSLDRAALLEDFDTQRQELQIAYERERALASTVREIGCPVIPLLPGVLLIPLIGAIDMERADQIIKVVLDEVGRQGATEVLIDITGVPVIDTHVANVLIQLARMTSLLGARSFMVGVRPEIAQSIVGLGINLSGIVTSATLADAISRLQRRSARG